MQFLVETDNHIEGRRQLADHVQDCVRACVGHFADMLTHIDAHLGDVNGADKSGAPDKRCLLEARVSGVKNIAVSHLAPTLHQAIEGAAQKLRHALDSAVGKMNDQKRRSEGLGHQAAELLPDDAKGE
ncbi:MAG: ribosomal subunit interface protein [Burkholderiaceae bacterium]